MYACFFLSPSHSDYTACENTEMYFGTWEGSLSNATLPPWPPQKHRVAIFTGAYSHIVDGVSLTLNRLVRCVFTLRFGESKKMYCMCVRCIIIIYFKEEGDRLTYMIFSCMHVCMYVHTHNHTSNKTIL